LRGKGVFKRFDRLRPCRIFAYYLGGLKPDDEDPGEAEARALNYKSRDEYLAALLNGEKQEINKRFKKAARRLFAQADLDFDRRPARVLFAAFVRMIEELPEQWFNWLNSNLQEECRSAPIGTESQTPHEFFLSAANDRATAPPNRPTTRRSRIFRVFTQIKVPLRAEDLLREECKACFWVFRRYIHPGMKLGWWQQEIANELQRFYRSLGNGQRPKVVLMAPPQHGKTEQATDFSAWVAGKRPDLKTIFASYSDELGITANLRLRRIMTSERYVTIFGRRLGNGGSRWLRNSNALEYVNQRGSFRNTTVEGQITGQGLDIGIIDDPIKGRIESSSKTVRDKCWAWFTDDFFTRFSDSAGLLMIMTRWHVDDPVGRYIKRFPEAKMLRYPAIAEQDETNRRKGEALFPQHKSLSFLMERKKVMTQAGWESEYQQNPIITGGGVIPIEKLRVLPHFDRSQIKRSCRYVDKAATEGGSGAFTAAVVMHQMYDGTYVISHIARGRWGALEREKKIKALVDADGKLFKNYEVGVEQEPGSAGKESAEATVRNLAGKLVFVDRVTGSKEVRAQPFIAQVQNNNVWLAAGEWIHEFLDECEAWPAGTHKDQVDAAVGAFNRLASGPMYDTTYKAFDPYYRDP
jgi:predicted phage terminase large subunit-like protein